MTRTWSPLVLPSLRWAASRGAAVTVSTFASGARLLLGLTLACLPLGCVDPADSDSESTPEKDPEEEEAPECTAETELARYREGQADSRRVPTPPECSEDVLHGSHKGQVGPPPYDDGWLDEPGRNEIWATWSGSTLVDFDGVPCEVVFPGEFGPDSQFGTEDSKCQQYFACGCCIVKTAREPLERRDIWTVDATAGCKIGMKPVPYYFNAEFPDAPPVPTPGGGGNACNDCLASCQGLSSCCTGTGCACESACRPSSDCGAGSTYCCGPDGFCFCTDACPY